MRVLLLADNCNPDWPSLPVVGYKACRAIADHVDVVLATHVRNEPAITRDGCGRAEVVYLDNEYIAAPMYKLSKIVRGGDKVSWTTAIAMAYPSYLAFERQAWKRFGDELRDGGFDVVHRVTPMSPTLPSPMARRSPVPFVLGPLNGGLKWPREFTQELRREREYLAYVRGAYRWLPYYKSTYRKAAAILAGFPHTIDDLPEDCRDRTIDFPEVGIDPELFSPPEERSVDGRLTFLFVGRLVPYKCPDVAVEAFARSEALREHRLLIVGDGPERPRLDEIVASNDLGKTVEFAGWVSQAEVGELMREAHAFVFPSIRELGAGVVVEAMGCGCTPVVVDYGAPGGLVTDASGVRVELGSKEELIDGYRAALEALVADPERLTDHARASYERCMTHFTWDAKARKTLDVYEWVTGQRSEKPTFEGEPTEATTS